MARRRPKTNSEGGRNPFPQTPRLPSALSQRRAERDAIMVPDFRQKKFELQSKSGAAKLKDAMKWRLLILPARGRQGEKAGLSEGEGGGVAGRATRREPVTEPWSRSLT